jgi:type I restriction enzyme M protein
MSVNVSGIIKSIRDIMREDRGINGDAQRIEQLSWLLFLKIFDDKDFELESLSSKYKSPIPKKYQWRSWAGNSEGMTGDELLNFINSELFPKLKDLSVSIDDRRGILVKKVFEDQNNYMKSGTNLRKVLNKLNEIDFNKAKERHLFGDFYEQMLKELQSAGAYGEFYTPRAVTNFLTSTIDPTIKDIVFDPACGTGGFLTSAIEHIRNKRKELKTQKDFDKLEKNIRGIEHKPLPYTLAITNLILHDIAIPSLNYDDSLAIEPNLIKANEKVDVILANPPFGGVVANGVERNFPQAFRTKETADLFLYLFISYLKDGGRAGIVLPDGSLSGDGVGARVREKLLNEANLHTIIRLHSTVFQPYASVSTNLLFFTKGKKTENVWYYELPLPDGVKAYNKGRPIQDDDFNDVVKWWNKRKENDFAWKVTYDQIKEKKFNLDFKNPSKNVVKESENPNDILKLFGESLSKAQK